MKRRHFLRGLAGVAVGLPWLESLAFRGLTSRAGAQAAGFPKRFVAFFECNGVNMERFWPRNYGPLTTASLAAESDRTLSVLADYAADLLVPRGIHMVPRGFGRDGSPGNDHEMGMGCKLTAAPLLEGDHYAAGISVDQEIARKLNPGGRNAMTLYVGRPADGVLGHISYLGANQPVRGENNPWRAYRDMMGIAPGGPAEAMLAAREQSVLDLVKEDLDGLRRMDLGRADRQKLDMHFSAIRELEMSLAGAVPACGLAPARAAELETIDPNTVGNDAEFKRVGRMQMDVLALALACNYTRAASIQWGSGAGGPIFTWDGMSHEYNHHKLSHGNTRDDDSGSVVDGYEAMLAAIDRFFAGEFRYLLDRLAGYEEGGARLLDHTCVAWLNELSHGKDHDFRDLPVVLAGSCGGYLRTGRYVKVTSHEDPRNDDDAPHNQLLTTLLNAVGVEADDGGPVTTFGAFGEPGEIDALKA